MLHKMEKKEMYWKAQPPLTRPCLHGPLSLTMNCLWAVTIFVLVTTHSLNLPWCLVTKGFSQIFDERLTLASSSSALKRV